MHNILVHIRSKYREGRETVDVCYLSDFLSPSVRQSLLDNPEGFTCSIQCNVTKCIIISKQYRLVKFLPLST